LPPNARAQLSAYALVEPRLKIVIEDSPNHRTSVPATIKINSSLLVKVSTLGIAVIRLGSGEPFDSARPL
jgi:hypothetical protein